MRNPSNDRQPWQLYHYDLLHEPRIDRPEAIPQVSQALCSVLHQLSTDEDLDTRVSAPHKYHYLELKVRLALAALHGIDLDPLEVEGAEAIARIPTPDRVAPLLAALEKIADGVNHLTARDGSLNDQDMAAIARGAIAAFHNPN